MHPFEADDDKEPLKGWVFVHELPAFWQSMGFYVVLFSKELPETLNLQLFRFPSGAKSVVATRIKGTQQYACDGVTFTMVAYDEPIATGIKLSKIESHPFYVGNENFPSTEQIYWCVKSILLPGDVVVTGVNLK